MENENHILIVENCPAQTAAIQSCLEQKGYKVSLAENCEQALVMLKHITPTVIISDILMPGIINSGDTLFNY